MESNASHIIEKIKGYLLDFNHEAFYADIEYNNHTYKASNLLISLLISETLSIEFYYFENINTKILEKYLNNIVLKHYKDPVFKENIIKLLEEFMNINELILSMNTTTFSYHELLSGEIDINTIKEDAIKELNDNIRSSLKIVNEAESNIVQQFRNVNSDISKLIDSGARGNNKQIGQEFLFIGYKVDNKSNIIKKPISSSFYNGLQSKEEMYIAALGCRNAIIQGTGSVADSGYLNRKLSFGSVDVVLSNTLDCGSTNYLEVDITEDNKNNILYGRYILEDNKLKAIFHNNNKDYVGKRVKLRSPVTCKCEDGICKTCYGHMSVINNGLSIGLLAATTIAEMGTQTFLSAKHLLFASLNKENKFIMELIDILHDENTVIAKKDITIKVDHLEQIMFKIDDKFVEYRHNFKYLTFSKDCDEIIDNEKYYYFKENDVIFNNIQDYICSDMNILMKKVNIIFEKIGYMKDVNTIDEYYLHMYDVIRELGNIPSVHIEIILSQMVKVKDEHQLLYRHHQERPYEIVSIKKSNLSNSLFNSILFERVKQNISSLNNYFKDNTRKTKYEKLFIK